MKLDYEEFCALGRRKNKANLLAFSVLRSADSVKMRKRNLKKQSQFVTGIIGAKSYMKGNCGNRPVCEGEKTKPISESGLHPKR